MKVIQNFVVINVCLNHFNEKVCWTSRILGENPWKKYDICCLFWWTSCWRLVFVAWRKTHNKNVSHFFKNILKGFLKFSKLFHWKGWDKHWSPQKKEEIMFHWKGWDKHWSLQKKEEIMFHWKCPKRIWKLR